MKSNIRTFIASSELFSGFSVDIDLNYCNTINDIIHEFKNKLLFILKSFHFEILIEKLEQINFHIHNYTFEDIIISDKIRKFYICQCENNIL